MAIVFSWNPQSNGGDRRKGHAVFERAKRQGRKIYDPTGKEMTVFDGCAGQITILGGLLKHRMRVDVDGELAEYEWLPNRPGSFLQVKLRFDDFLRRGYRAFNIMQGGSHGRWLTSFDPWVPEILVVNHFFLTEPPGYVPGYKAEEGPAPEEYYQQYCRQHREATK